MKKFEVGMWYEPQNPWDAETVKIVKRTEKSITVTSGFGEYRMMIRKDENGDEYAVNSSVPIMYRDSFKYSSNNIMKGVNG